MLNRTVVLVFTVLMVSVLACSNEPASTTSPEPQSASTAAATAPQAANIVSISREKIMLKDNSEIVFPKEADKTSIVFYFATPGQSKEGATSLSVEGQAQGNRLSGTMAAAGLTVVYVEGNAAMQTALGTARANQSELNIFTEKNASETLKLLAHNYLGKKVMVVASAPILTSMMTQITGKTDISVPATPNNNLYVVTAKALGDGEVKTVTY